MELKQIKELMTAMGRTGTKKLMLKKEGFELQLEREENDSFHSGSSLEFVEDVPYRTEISQRTNAALSKGKELTTSLGQSAIAIETDKDAATHLYVTSPMVGTFYSSPSPDDPSFVKVGDKVEKHTVVCIIEAMKVMNEVKAGVTGTIVEILVESGHPVEFGSKLFRIV